MKFLTQLKAGTKIVIYSVGKFKSTLYFILRGLILMAGKAQLKDKDRILKEAKEYYTKILAIISDIEDGASEREACDAHGLTLNKFRNDTLYRKRFGCNDKYEAAKLYLSPYERIFGDVMKERLDFISIQTLPIDLESTIESVMDQVLSEKEIQLFKMCYFDDMTFTDIGKVMNLSVSRVSQLHHDALRKLRKPTTKYRISAGDAYISRLRAERQEYWLRRMTDVRDEYKAEIDEDISNLVAAQKAYDSTVLHKATADASIEALGISTRAYVALWRAGVTSIQKLQKLIDSDSLVKLRGIGPATANNIVWAVDRYFNP